ncbi:MAG: capsular biosynthesis protein [Hyphomicrobiales bacterium]|nr:capsular biosynthesis protein [Hyphomicrobiales bacterium]
MNPRDIGIRTVLMLQGPPTPFARELGDALEAAGHKVLRINLCAGDWLYWLGRPAVQFRGKLADWEPFLERFMAQNGVTDVLYYADRHPYHRAAAAVARRLGATPVTYEFGYLRPDWITLEHGGMSAHSHFPADPETIRAIAAQATEPDMTVRYKHAFRAEAFHEVAYNLSTVFLSFLYPHYDADRYYGALQNYLSYIPRLTFGRWKAQRANRVTTRQIRRDRVYYLAPLQMQSDYQLRVNSPYRHQREMIEQVICSFKRAAPEPSKLIFKVHPLDNGLENWPRVARRIAEAHGVLNRIRVIDGGDLAALLQHARGVVVINSTVGLHALKANCPLKVLGFAVFDIPGLAYQGELDDFWTKAPRPDAALRDDFIKALAVATQVKGSFYHREGRKVGAAEIVRRLELGLVNEPGAFVSPPPRLAAARAKGVPFTAWETLGPVREAPSPPQNAGQPSTPTRAWRSARWAT